jgi:hypothetical protein
MIKPTIMNEATRASAGGSSGTERTGRRHLNPLYLESHQRVRHLRQRSADSYFGSTRAWLRPRGIDDQCRAFLSSTERLRLVDKLADRVGTPLSEAERWDKDAWYARRTGTPASLQNESARGSRNAQASASTSTGGRTSTSTSRASAGTTRLHDADQAGTK